MRWMKVVKVGWLVSGWVVNGHVGFLLHPSPAPDKLQGPQSGPLCQPLPSSSAAFPALWPNKPRAQWSPAPRCICTWQLTPTLLQCLGGRPLRSSQFLTLACSRVKLARRRGTGRPR